MAGSARYSHHSSSSQKNKNMTGGVFLGGVAQKSEACQTKSQVWMGGGENAGTVVFCYCMEAGRQSKGGRSEGSGVGSEGTRLCRGTSGTWE